MPSRKGAGVNMPTAKEKLINRRHVQRVCSNSIKVSFEREDRLVRSGPAVRAGQLTQGRAPAGITLTSTPPLTFVVRHSPYKHAIHHAPELETNLVVPFGLWTGTGH